MTQQNTALVEEASAAAHELNDQAAHLNELVEQFILDATVSSVSYLPKKASHAAGRKVGGSLRLVNG